MLDEPPERWDAAILPPERAAELDRYLHSRRSGANDWIVFGRGTRLDAFAYLAERGIDPAAAGVPRARPMSPGTRSSTTRRTVSAR